MAGIELSLLFGVINSAKSIGDFFNIIESVDVKINKLIKSELNAGLESLRQAQISSCEKTSLLREARFSLNKAIHLEKQDRLFTTYIALAFCHYHLQDIPNTKAKLFELSKLEINYSKEYIIYALIGENAKRPGLLVAHPAATTSLIVLNSRYIYNLFKKQKRNENSFIDQLIEKYEKIEIIQKQAKEIALSL